MKKQKNKEETRKTGMENVAEKAKDTNINDKDDNVNGDDGVLLL